MDDVKRARGWRAWLGSRCVLSGMRPAIDGLHPAWRARLPRLASYCPMCAQPQDHDWVCGRCYESPPAYTATFAAWQYALPIDHLISRFKYQGELAVAPALASAFRDCAPSPPDGAVMVPVPSHRQRLRERGFDHIAMLAKDICRPLSIPLQMDVLRRVRHTPAQSGLTASQRQRNLAGAFAVSGAVPETIILFDDVITTGATVRAASKVLKRAGAKQLIVWALARA